MMMFIEIKSGLISGHSSVYFLRPLLFAAI